ncbi:putative hemolysin [Acetobacter oeni]|nr:DUF333 domain-containing protein [Acetobacter oeni]MBB3882504.1 hypothetical protein [Acetobacter oeni]NHO18684.1 DUF333 domain-containing protein [Acetobacter oeni]
MRKLFVPGLFCLLAGCSGHAAPSGTDGRSSQVIGMPNPASVYCQKVGGTLEIRKEAGGSVGYCHLPNGRVVEEWSLFRSEARKK